MKSLKFKVIIFAIIAYLILFEFLFPNNSFFPSISVIWFSIIELFEKYSLLSKFFSTFSAVYLTVIGSYLIVKLLFILLFSKDFEYKKDNSRYPDLLFSFFKYSPFVIIIFLLLSWFSDFILIKYLVALLIILSLNLSYLIENNDEIISDYFLFYKSLGLSDSFIINKIIFKLKEPEFFLLQLRNHSFIWSVIIITEFIQQKDGVGSIIYIALRFSDISLMFSLSLLLVIIIFIMNSLLKIVYDKIYFWS